MIKKEVKIKYKTTQGYLLDDHFMESFGLTNLDNFQKLLLHWLIFLIDTDRDFESLLVVMNPNYQDIKRDMGFIASERLKKDLKFFMEKDIIVCKNEKYYLKNEVYEYINMLRIKHYNKFKM